MVAIHNSPYSGTWYPDRAAELEQLLDKCFDTSLHRTGPFLYPDAFAYVVPHAGLSYSGAVASAVYRSLELQKPERIVLLAFPHRGGLHGVASPDINCIATPLGELSLDRDFEAFPRLPESHLCDHSFEIQLPFLQKAAPRAQLTVLYVGRLDAAQRHEAAHKLADQWRPGVVFLASSDFTHYGRSFGYRPFPADRMVAANLRELDQACIDAAGSLDAELFLNTIAGRRATVCGTGPIALLLDVLRELGCDNIYQQTLDYQTSGEITGDYHDSVSYAALGYFPRTSFDLNAADRAALLEAANATLGHLRRTREGQPVVAQGSPALSTRRGAFVSLHHGEELLGCIGNCAGRKPLQEEISELTLAAALHDPRFRPATSHHGVIDIELSVLTPFRRIRDISQFQLGHHGAYLRLSGRSGLLLPQVAADGDWTVESFWTTLAVKSRLAPNAWRDPNAELQIFEAQVFGCK